MKIIVTPEDIILRCLWSNYKRFVLFDKTETDIKDIIEKNETIIISENDAYAIGLLKVIETDNFIHRFNQHILEILQIKSNIFNDEIFINRNVILKELSSYKNRFPKYYQPIITYKLAIDDLTVYIDELAINIEKLDITKQMTKDKEYEYYLSKQIKKLLKL